MRDRDGRNIDEALGTLSGEAAQVRVESIDDAFPGRREPYGQVPSVPAPGETIPTYYGQPAIKEPLWIWSIPVYFHVGGVSAAAATLGAVAHLAGDRTLAQRCKWVATFGTAASAGLLIYDLGKPSRFLNMLRVFRPTSPMNVGTWIVTGAGACSGAAAVLGALPGLRRAGDGAALAAGMFGPPLATYTAVLVCATAVPVWQATRRSMPFLFAASAAGAMGSFFSLLEQSRRHHRITRRVGILGKAASLLVSRQVEKDAARTPGVDLPLRQGRAGTLWKAAKWLEVASLALDLLPGEGKRKRVAAGTLGTLASLALRFAVTEAGKQSARDPAALFRQQRQGHGAAEVTGEAGVVGPGEARATG